MFCDDGSQFVYQLFEFVKNRLLFCRHLILMVFMAHPQLGELAPGDVVFLADLLKSLSCSVDRQSKRLMIISEARIASGEMIRLVILCGLSILTSCFD